VTVLVKKTLPTFLAVSPPILLNQVVPNELTN